MGWARLTRPRVGSRRVRRSRGSELGRSCSEVAGIYNLHYPLIQPALRSSDGTHSLLKASLVFADNGELVPGQKGEAPLAGEIDAKRPTEGECHFRIRVAALSYRHGRRPFAIRIDADALPGSGAGCFACSPAIRSVARLPNEAKYVPRTANHGSSQEESTAQAALSDMAVRPGAQNSDATITAFNIKN